MAISNTTATLELKGKETNGVRTYVPHRSVSKTFGDGSGADQVLKVASYELTIGGSPSDLALNPSTVWKDADGVGITWTAIKAIMIEAPSTNSANVVIGNQGTTDWATFLSLGGTLTLPPGASMVLVNPSAAGFVVASGKTLRVSGTSGNVCTITIFGK